MTTQIRTDEKMRIKRIARDRAEEFIVLVYDLFSAYETTCPDGNKDSNDSVLESVFTISKRKYPIQVFSRIDTAKGIFGRAKSALDARRAKNGQVVQIFLVRS